MMDGLHPTPSEPVARASRLLVVDDHPAALDPIRDYFLTLGYAVDTASDGLMALERVAQTPPDVMLLDLIMPGMDGVEVCRRLKTEPQTADIGIILMTAFDELNLRLDGLRNGADDYIAKPFSMEELALRVALQVRATAARRDLQAVLGREQRKTGYLETVTEVTRQITTLTDGNIDTVCEAVAQSLVDRFGYEYVSIFLIDATTEKIVPQAQAGVLAERMKIRFPLPPEPLGRGIVGHVCRTGQSYLTNDRRTDPYWVPNPFVPELWEHLRSELCVPIGTTDRVLGCLNLESSHLHAFDSSDQLMLETLAGHLAVALTNARLYREAVERGTELTVAYAELKQMHATIVQAEREKAALDTVLQTGLTLSHEINNPLTAVIGFSELLAREYPNRPEFRLILEAGQRIADVVQRLNQLRTVQVKTYLPEIPIPMLDLGLPVESKTGTDE